MDDGLGHLHAVVTASELDHEAAGSDIYALAALLYPICRSITGPGVRATLGVLGQHVPIETNSFPTGSKVFDWTIPPEWIFRDACIKDESGTVILDAKACNLHVLNYSAPFRGRVPLSILKEHASTLPDQPDLIPYRTSYYVERWGVCMSHNQLLALPEGDYEINIDSEFVDGRLEWGEYTHRGESEDIILFSAHICHPSLANDNCSGLALLAHLAGRIAQHRTRYTYRFVFAPGTIGSIAWLARNEDLTGRIRHGLVLSCVGDAGVPSYKRSRRGNEVIDRAMTHVLQHRSPSSQVSDFAPFGYDERQFCSPGFDLPVGSFQRSRFGEFPEYHASADNLDFIAPRHLGDSYSAICETIEVLESAHVRLRRRDPRCEPQLAKYGLYGKGADHDRALLWVLNLADGEHSLLDMAERAKMPFTIIRAAAAKLQACGLVRT